MLKKRLFSLLLIFVIVFQVSACGEDSPPDTGTTYKITFNCGVEGISVSPIQKAAGFAITEPEEPVREGYKFDGWYLDGEKYVFWIMPEKDVNLTAKWSKLYTVTIQTESGTEALIFAAGEDIVIPAPTRPHYKFDGWQLDGVAYTPGSMPEEDILLVASWIAAVTISFKTGFSDLAIEPIVEVAGAAISAPEAPQYAGHRFDGWYYGNSPFVFANMPAADIELTARWIQYTNLPSMYVDIKDIAGNTISLSTVNSSKSSNSKDYFNCYVSMDNTTAKNTFNSAQAEVRGRGNGSWQSGDDKKNSYRLKFNTKQQILGNPSSKHWILHSASSNGPGYDNTLAKNYTAFKMAKELFSDLEYVTSAEYVDLYFNGSYHGVYLILEHVRVDKDRINISSQFGVENTGFLVEYDNYARKTESLNGINYTPREGVDYFTVSGLRNPFSICSPDPDDFLAEGLTEVQFRNQVTAIKNSVQTLVNAILSKNFETFSTLADVGSFIDMYILHELFKNTDTGHSSFFMYKKAGADGKIYCGAPWDFDFTAGTSRGSSGYSGIYVGYATSGSAAQHSDGTSSEIFIALTNTPAFFNMVVARWKVLAPAIVDFVNDCLSNDFISANRFAMGRNFVRWNGSSQVTREAEWVSRINTLRNWLLNRTNWLSTSSSGWSNPKL